jgi:hypothetical protein
MQAILWSDEHAMRAATYAVARLVECRLDVHPASRLPRARQTVERSRAHSLIEIRTQGELSERVLEAHRTIIEFYCIATSIRGPEDSLVPVIRRALSGSATVREDRTGEARNFQFEALIAALIRHAGISGVSADEPDVRIAAGDTFVGISAKRVTSLDRHQREKNVRKAVAQILRQDTPGLVVLNLDSLSNDAMQRGGHTAADDALQQAVVEASRFIEQRQPGGRVGGVFGFATLLGWNTAVWPAVLAVDFSCHAHLVAPEQFQQSALSFLSQRGARLTESLVRIFGEVALFPPAT